MKELIAILKIFDDKRDEERKNSANWDADAVKRCFMPCARAILCNGYFLINGNYIIDIGAIELYYHEEEGNIKDYIMYHTNAHPYKSRMSEFAKGYPYFKIGSFNLHQSGLDVTFEKPDKNKKYRASFLIRSYRLLEAENGKYPLNDNTKYDHCSTHIFDDMFYEGVSFSDTRIEWRILDKGKEMDEPTFRINVPIYREKANMKYEKLTREFLTEHNMILSRDSGLAIENHDGKSAEKEHLKTFRANGKEYIRDIRPWRFCLKDIYEKSKEDGR
jgi:hypothetical protein